MVFAPFGMRRRASVVSHGKRSRHRHLRQAAGGKNACKFQVFHISGLTEEGRIFLVACNRRRCGYKALWQRQFPARMPARRLDLWAECPASQFLGRKRGYCGNGDAVANIQIFAVCAASAYKENFFWANFFQVLCRGSRSGYGTDPS